MKRIGVLIVLLVCVMLVGMWWYPHSRHVDGRSGSQWLAFVQQASQTVSYQATGVTNSNGQRARFILEQGCAGCYTMQVTGPGGQCASLGYDGQRMWYVNDQQASKAVVGAPSPVIPAQARCRIDGAGIVAGQAIIRLSVRSGETLKKLAVDRHTGVILAMTTYVAQRQVSDMQVEQINYQPVTVAQCTLPAVDALRPVTDTEVRAILGRDAVRPTWLPQGLRSAGVYQTPCACCPEGMIAVRYTDGISTVTLFEMSGLGCTMNTGCHQAPTGHALVESRELNGLSITAVGTLDSGDMRKMLDSLR